MLSLARRRRPEIYAMARCAVKKDLFAVLYVLSLMFAMSSVISGQITFNVLDYGAVGDGQADDTSAFIQAWDQACSSAGESSTIIIPEGNTFLVQPTTFKGECKPTHIHITLAGTVIAPDDSEAWKGKDIGEWLGFRYVNGLTITGGGVLDGRGKHWWDNSCRYHPGPGCGTKAPTTLAIAECHNLHLSQISSRQSGGLHINIFGSHNVTLNSVAIRNPGDSPNTDGIHLSHTVNATITDSTIGTGDDCIAILDRVYNVNINYIRCGPGHGVSIGSLGGNGQVVDVQNITVTNVGFYGTTNGARIKTKPGGGGEVSNVVFSNLYFKAAENPIIIDQHYGLSKRSPRNQPYQESGVRIHNVSYSRLFGTSASRVGVTLDCSVIAPCTNIKLESILLNSTKGGKPSLANCHNAYGTTTGMIGDLDSCLQPSSA